MAMPESMSSIEIHMATPDDVYWIADKEKEVYKGNPLDVMPLNLIQSWYRKNPACFWIIKGAGRERIGNIYVFPLKPDALEKLIRGEIFERDIRPADIYSRRESGKITALHICSLVCPDSSEGTVQFMRNLPRIFESICGPGQLEYIYALSASPGGDNLLKRNGFSVVDNGTGRKDGHPFYRIVYKDLLARLNQRFSTMKPAK